MSKFNNSLKILYLILAVLTILEYMFVTGMFTSLIALILIDVVGIINLCISVKEKQNYEAALFAVSTVALSMGYWKLMF